MFSVEKAEPAWRPRGSRGGESGESPARGPEGVGCTAQFRAFSGCGLGDGEGEAGSVSAAALASSYPVTPLRGRTEPGLGPCR